MLIMNNLELDSASILTELGRRLKRARLTRNETQEVFSGRIGLTRQTYSKMEKGASTVPIGYWLEASEMLGLLNTWQDVMSQKDNLFEQYDQRQEVRQRASRKRSGNR